MMVFLQFSRNQGRNIKSSRDKSYYKLDFLWLCEPVENKSSKCAMFDEFLLIMIITKSSYDEFSNRNSPFIVKIWDSYLQIIGRLFVECLLKICCLIVC